MTTLTASQDRSSTVPITVTSVTLSVLGLLTLAGVLAGLGRLLLGLGATTALSDGYSWGIWIGFDFVLIAFSGAGFTIAAVAHVFHLKKFQPVVRPAILTGLLGYTAVLLLLVLDLGRPDRFYNFILYWNLHSPLFEISCCILLYTTVLAIETSPFLLERLPWELPVRLLHRFMGPISIIGVVLSSLHQSTLGTLYLNMPHRLNALWFSPIMSLLFFISSIMAGLSIATIAYAAASRVYKRKAQPDLLNGLARGAAWVTVLYVFVKLAELAVAGEWPALLRFDGMSWLMWLELGLCGIVPAALLLLPALRNSPLVRWVGLGLILLGVLANRFNATMFAQTQPPGTPPYVPHILEWLSTIGILAGVALAWYLCIRFLVIFDSQAERKYHH